MVANRDTRCGSVVAALAHCATPHPPSPPPLPLSPSSMGNWSHSLSSPIAAELEAGPYRPPNPTMSIPQPEPWFAWIVPTIFIIATLAFAASMYVNDCPGHFDNCLFSSYLGRYAFQSFKENPLLGPSPFTLVKMGALNKPLVVDKGEGWRLITCMWLHVGVIHLAANMTSLLFIGIRLEQEFGFWRIGLLFVLSGFGGSLTSALHLETISVGASGALFGLLGAMLSELIMNWSLYANKCAALSTLLLVIAFNLAIGLLPNIDSSAHIGGFVSGFLLGFILLIRPQFGYVSRKYIPEGYALKYVKPKHKCYQYLLWVVAFVILIVGYAIGLNKLFNGHPPTHLSNWVPPNVFNGNPPEQLFNRNQPDQLLNGQTPHQ